MKTCPFCIGQIPDAAVKCQHCGEWVDGRPASPPPPSSPSPTDPLGHAANRWVSNSNALGWAGFVMAVFVILFIMLPVSCEMRNQRKSHQFPNLPMDLKRP